MRYGGVYRGMVVDNADPDRRGRVRIQVPAIGPVQSWALVCRQPGATGSIPVGSSVIVAFEGGDPAAPVVLGIVS